MTTVFLDPDQMDATGGAINEHAREVEAMATEVDGLAATSVPSSIAGWFAEEMHEIALSVRLGALLYLVATVDALQRAEAIRANQSLAAVVTAPASTTATFSGPAFSSGFVLGEVQPAVDPFTSPASGGGGFVLGQVDTSGYTPIEVTVGVSQEQFLAHNPLLRAAAAAQQSNPGGAAQLMGLHGLMSGAEFNAASRTINDRPGVSSLGNGLFSGQGRIGSQIYRNPKVPGEYLVG